MERKWRVVELTKPDSDVRYRVDSSISDGSWMSFAYRPTFEEAKEIAMTQKAIDQATETVVYEV